MKRLSVIPLCITVVLLLWNCSGKENPLPSPDPVPGALVERVNLPAVTRLTTDNRMSIAGIGFKDGDMVEYKVDGYIFDKEPVSDIEYSSCKVRVPVDIKSGTSCSLVLFRQNVYQVLGSTTINRESTSTSNIKGKVSCNGNGVKGVWVCDGEIWVQTDAGGNYEMKSGKRRGYVYIVTPSSYEPFYDGCWPVFWKTVGKDEDVTSTADFELKQVNDQQHQILMSADWQLRGSRTPRDVDQARRYFSEVLNYKSKQSVPVFAVSLGDETWDSGWSLHGFTPSAFREWAKDFPVPLYTVIGNHDHNIQAADDFSGADDYRLACGPTCFSMNKGSIHYVIMDNVDYVPALPSSSCNDRFTPAQLAWLKEDLSHVDTSTPIVLCVHIPMHSWGWSGSSWRILSRGENYADAISMLKKFSCVHIFAGHSHLNEHFDLKASGFSTNEMYEHKIVALGGNIWVSLPQIGYNVARDGVPDGYEILEVDGKNINWRFKATDSEADCQMRCYSVSALKSAWKDDIYISDFAAFNPEYSFTSLYGELPEDAVMINVFAADPQQKTFSIEVTDTNGPLDVKNCRVMDPTSLVANDIWNWKDKRTLISNSYRTCITQHIFYVQPAGKNIKVILKDIKGNIISEKVIALPIEFNYEHE